MYFHSQCSFYIILYLPVPFTAFHSTLQIPFVLLRSEGMAEYYSAELSEKAIRGHTENALKCKYNGGTPTFGYFIDKDKHGIRTIKCDCPVGSRLPPSSWRQHLYLRKVEMQTNPAARNQTPETAACFRSLVL